MTRLRSTSLIFGDQASDIFIGSARLRRLSGRSGGGTERFRAVWQL